MLKVFISSAMGEFKIEREEIKKVVEGLHLTPKLAEHEGTIDDGVRKALKNWVEKCDIYLGILGYCYSEATVQEYHYARQMNKTIILLVKECYPSCTIDDKQQQFLNRIKEEKVYLYKEFKDDLLQRVKHSIIYSLAENFNKVKHLPKYLSDHPALLSNTKDFEFVDLTHDITPVPYTSDKRNREVRIQSVNLPASIKIKNVSQYAFKSGVIHDLPTNAGTHIDLWGHIQEVGGGRRINQYALDEHLIGSALVLDFSSFTNDRLRRHVNSEGDIIFNSNASRNLPEVYLEIIASLEISTDIFNNAIDEADITLEEIKDNIDFILIHTGLSKFYDYKFSPLAEWRNAYFLNPYFNEEIIDILGAMNLKGVGSDTLRLECPLINITEMLREGSIFELTEIPQELKEATTGKEMIPFHKKMLMNRAIIIENLTNLDRIVNKKCYFFLAPPKLDIENSDTDMIVRAFALNYKI